jgi:non-heme chloroperoxidase
MRMLYKKVVMKHIKVNERDFAYIEQGQGEPVLMLHGTLGDYRSWELQLGSFAEKYRTISYSRRYHYPNECSGTETDYSARLHAQDLSTFISALGLESANIVGNSYGAYTAMFHAIDHPEQVRSLVLSEPPVIPLLDRNEEGASLRNEFLKKIWSPAGEALKRGETEKGVKIFVDGVVTEGAFDSFPREVQQLIMDNACEFKAETSSSNFWTHFTCEDAARIQTPTLLLTGERSLKMLKLVVEELDRCLPNNELVTVPSSSHETASENPEAYNEIVLSFLARHNK